MDFTELYKQSSNLCRFSPNGAYLATAVQYRLVIRDAETLQILHLFSCIDAISDVQWAPDSDLIFATSNKLGCIQVFSLRDPNWTAKMEEGLSGLVAARWAPDARHILAFSDFQLRVTVWSLVSKEAFYMQYPKFPSEKAYSFRKDGKYLALAERRETKDYISIYDCETWAIVKYFPVDTNDLDGIAWSPDGRFIAVWENPLEYKIMIYYPDGRLVSSYSAYEFGLGIKTVKWSPSSQFLAVGSYDQKVRLLNHYTWKPIIEFSHPVNLTYPDISVFKEHDEREIRYDPKSLAKNWNNLDFKPKLAYQHYTGPTTISTSKPDMDKPCPKMGVGLLEFDPTGRLLVTRNDNMPTTLFIFDLIALRQVAVIQNLLPIKTVSWNPVSQHPQLVFSCVAPVIPVGGDVEQISGWVYVWEGIMASKESAAVEADGSVEHEGNEENEDSENTENNSGNLPSKHKHEHSHSSSLIGGGVCEVIEVPAVNFQVHHFAFSPNGKSLVMMDRDKFCVSFLVE